MRFTFSVIRSIFLVSMPTGSYPSVIVDTTTKRLGSQVGAVPRPITLESDSFALR